MFRGLKAFKKDFKDYVDRVPKKGMIVTRKVASNWFSEVVKLTPKDSNFASSKWDYTINSKPPSYIIDNPRGGNYLPAKSPSFMNFKPGDTLYLFNNVAYIRRLEDGYSSKAPRNFFKNSIARADRRLQKEYKKIK